MFSNVFKDGNKNNKLFLKKMLFRLASHNCNSLLEKSVFVSTEQIIGYVNI